MFAVASSFSLLPLSLPSALIFSGSVVMNGLNFRAGKTGVWFHSLTHPVWVTFDKLLSLSELGSCNKALGTGMAHSNDSKKMRYC